MKKWIIAGLVLLVAGVFIAYKIYNKPHQNIEQSKADLSIEATALYEAFETDESAANQLYNDKLVLVSGQVSQVGKDEEGTVTVTLDSGSQMGGVICQLDDLSQHQRLTFQTGETVQFKGLCTGYLMDVVLVRCVEVGNQ